MKCALESSSSSPKEDVSASQGKLSSGEKKDKSNADSRSKSSEKDARKPEEENKSEIVYQKANRQELQSQEQKERKRLVNNFCEDTTVASSTAET